MALKRKEHSDDLRTLVIKHFLNGDSQREIAEKTLLSRETVRSMIKKNIKVPNALGTYSVVVVNGRRQRQLIG